jgi:hypothetical protein
MPVRRVRFTIRGLMIAVAAIGGFLAILRLSPVLLVAFLVLNIPTAVIGLCVVMARAPGRRLPGRVGIVTALQGGLILVVGWAWSLTAIAFFQQRVNAGAPPEDSRRTGYEFWCSTVPMTMTGLGLAAFVLGIAVICVLRHRSDLMPVVAAYAWAMAVTWVLSFAFLKFGVFL